MLASREPGLVALQEVWRPGLSRLRTLLRDSGLVHQVDSFELAADPALLTGPRRYGLLIASRFPLRAWEPGCFDVPWPERILSVDIEMPWGLLAMHTTHIPPGVTNGWIKIEMLEGLYAGLTHPSTIPRLLCGDFNTPQLERPTGEVVTWGQRLNRQGVTVIRQYMRGGEGVCWDRGEQQVLQGLAADEASLTMPSCRVWQHPILRYLRLLAAIMIWPPTAERCTVTWCSHCLTRQEGAHGR